MEIEILVNIFWTFVILGLLHFILYFVLRQYQIYAFRERLFSLRDDMFLYAQEGNIEFEHPAYRYLRRTINSMIRGAHRYDPFRIFIIWASIKLRNRDKFLISTQKEMDEAIESIGEAEVRITMSEFRSEMLKLAIKQLFFRARLLMVLYLILIVIIFVKAILKDIRNVSVFLLKESLFKDTLARDFIEQEARLRSRVKAGTAI